MADTRRGSVLIIDDNSISRTILTSLLGDEGYEIVGVASNGEHGIEMAVSLQPDVICLDITMPKISGLEVLAEIRPKLLKTVIMMVSANNDSETVKAAVQGGANGYIIKPFNTGLVLESIAQALVKMRRRAVSA